jgi:hypothetical protein
MLPPCHSLIVSANGNSIGTYQWLVERALVFQVLYLQPACPAAPVHQDAEL